jgi:galactokinase-like galactose-binding protein/GHMP kinase-like protein
MFTRALTKPDGRPLYLYSRRPIVPSLEAPSPSHHRFAPNARLRWHPLRGEWDATDRQHRTFLPPPEYNPLGPTVDEASPTELPDGTDDIAVFENLFPSLTMTAHDPPALEIETRIAPPRNCAPWTYVLTDSVDAATSFEAVFGRPALVEREAPGRVNLIGEHTDDNEGFVCPIATPQMTVVSLAPRPDQVVRLWSANVEPAARRAECGLGEERRRGSWEDYAQGVTAAARSRGLTFTGFDARFLSTVPLGAGLSSSASFEVALVRALVAAYNLPLDDIEIARIGHDAETGLVGAPVGSVAAVLPTWRDVSVRNTTRALVPFPRQC